jgi:predicted enzyme related to lactoylglutathione lyase
MGTRTSYTPGTICWVDLVVEDPAAAKAFYGGLFGWEYEGPDDYAIAQRDGGAVAAILPKPDPSMPPHWNTYVSVEDAEATAAEAQRLGATILLPAGDVGESGRVAVFQDPQGAVLSLWQPGQDFGASVVNGPGLLSWNDLLSPDPAASAAFYGELFGWEITEIAPGQYWSIANAGARNGGMMPVPPRAHPAWNLYFGSTDAAATVAQAQALGGSLVMGPMEVPGGTFAIIRDPQNAVFSIVDGEFDD